jgi:hypothetical protein
MARERQCLGIVASGIISAFAQLLPSTAWAAPERVIADQYIIQRDDSNGNSKSPNAAAGGAPRSFEVVRVPSRSGQAGTGGDAEMEAPLDWGKVAADCEELKKDPSVASCEPDLIRELSAVPNESWFPWMWWLYDKSSVSGDFGVTSAWDRGTGSKSILLGVLDSGVHFAHADLEPNMWVNPADPLDGKDNDGNGYVDDKYGVNTYYFNNVPLDCSGHGTHVAGIIGAKGNNNYGAVGVNWTTSLIAVAAQRCGFSGLPMSAILAGYEYFYDLKRRGHNIRAVNASFGGSSPSNLEYAVINKLRSVDVIIVAAAGNESSNNDTTPSYPADYDLSNILSVGATDWLVQSAWYSNYGESVDIAAPGGDMSAEYGGILSTWSPLATQDTFFRYSQGTSMAAPMVTGVLGLIASHRPYLNGSHLKSMLLASADSRATLQGLVAGGRYLNAAKMSVAADPPDNCPQDPDKLDPALCGCGVPENYLDDDGDGTLSCLDACPSDPQKTGAGVCGCGIADTDGNANGQVDCQEVGGGSPGPFTGVPPKPRVKTASGKLIVTMQKMDGAQYLVEVSTFSKNKKKAPRVRVFPSAGNVARLKKPARGTRISIRYALRIPTTGVQSEWSAPRGMTVAQ